MTYISPSIGARTALLLSTSFAGFAVAVPAAAQDAAAQGQIQQQSSSSPASSENEILVTGSRVGRSTFETPNPVTVLDSEDVANLGLVNVAEVVRQLPQNSNFFSAN